MFQVVCVSEQPNWLQLYSGVLQVARHGVYCFTSVDDATRELPCLTFDLVMTDLQFKCRTDCFMLFNTARQRGIPIIVLSHDIAQVFHEPYADLYIEPPVPSKELLEIVSELLRCQVHDAYQPKVQAVGVGP